MFDLLAKRVEASHIYHETNAEDTLHAMHVLISPVLHTSSSRIQCVCRALLLKSLIEKCVALHPESVRVNALGDELLPYMLSLQLKAALKQRQRQKAFMRA